MGLFYLPDKKGKSPRHLSRGFLLMQIRSNRLDRISLEMSLLFFSERIGIDISIFA